MSAGPDGPRGPVGGGGGSGGSTGVAPLDVRRAAVIGAGVMGATIAAHLANAGIPTRLLDLRADGDDPDARARAGLEGARKARPAAFFSRRTARLVEVGNTEDHLEGLADCDWVVEAIVERLDLKQALYERLAPHLSPGALLTSNTSGLAAAELAAGLPGDLGRRFAVTHFFNPPRYLRLLELVPGPEADPAAMAGLAAFADRRLGKGVVHAKDTPNFIANRIGMFGLMQSLHAMGRHGLGVTEVDALTGPLLGRPPSATFRTADLVGLDTILHVAGNLHERLDHDPQRDVFAPPAWVRAMAEKGLLGAKSGAGFYRKGPDGIEQIDPGTLEYGPRPDVDLDLPKGPPSAGLAALLGRSDARGAFLREHLGASLHYAAACVPEISDRIEDVDRAMRWGFGWRFGPFEMWDLLGGEEGAPGFAARLEAAGLSTPPVVASLARAGARRFYDDAADGPTVFAPTTGTVEPLPPRPRTVPLGPPGRPPRLGGTDEISLIDIGEGVALLRFHSKLNTLSPEMGAYIMEALARVEERHVGLVIGNDAPDFSAGANLGVVLAALAEGDFDRVGQLVDAFQAMTQAVRFLGRPVVVAPRGRTLGGACELLMHAHGACAAAESFIGLVEVGAGLIPGGGGCKEWVRRIDEQALPGADLLPPVQRAFEAIGLAKVGTSAVESCELGYLRDDDPIVMNDEHLLHDARRRVLELAARDHVRPVPRADLRVMGEDGLAALRVALFNLREAGHATPHDEVVTTHVARILTGGGGRARRVSEQRLLELEKESFLSLCGTEATQARMKHLLATGKPLRN